MIESLDTIAGLSRDLLWISFVVFLRVGAMMSLMPGFGEQSVPQRIRLVLAFGFTLIVIPALITEIPAQTSLQPLDILRIMFVEVLAGLALGIAVRLFVLALQTSAAIAAQSTSLSQVFGGVGVDPQPAIGSILLVSGLAIAVMSGLHLQAVKLILLSYQIMPSGAFPVASDLSAWGLEQVTHAFALAFTLAAPFVIASLIYNVALGVINKAMPQLMVAFVGAPAITAGGMMLMVIAIPIMLSIWVDDLGKFFLTPFGGL
ncbi:flagellar biosynthetic protein FliR [Cognatishimia sp. MH4019]|uniref:flagellar biosynthetic protein FliR n=1 Tax=Cognatishimia sp. MH4019 TaxID=2854030 RepID=UPI00351D8C3B